MPLFTASATVFTMNDGNAVDKQINAFQLSEMAGAMKAFLKACIPLIPVRTGFLRAAFRPMRSMYLRGETGAQLDETPFTLTHDDAGKPVELSGLAALFGANRDLTRARFEHARTTNARGEKLTEAGQKARERAYEKEVQKNLQRWRKTKGGDKTARRTEWYYYGTRQRVAKIPANALQFVTPKGAGEVIRVRGLMAEIKFDININYYRINDFYSRITGSPWRSLDAGFQASLNYLENAARRYPLLTEILTVQRILLRGDTVTSSEEKNQVADYRRRFGSQFYDSAGAIRGAKMDAYPGSATKSNLTNIGKNERQQTDYQKFREWRKKK